MYLLSFKMNTTKKGVSRRVVMSQNSGSRSRGNISLFALISITILLGMALSQSAYVTLIIKGNQATLFGLEKEHLILNSAQIVRTRGTPGERDLMEDGHILEYLWQQSRGSLIEADRILVDIDREPHWPQVVQFWVKTPRGTLRLTDYWRE